MFGRAREGFAIARSFVLVALTAACGAREPLPMVGTSTVGANASANAARADAGAPAPSAIPGDFRASFTKLSRVRFMSRGHLEDRFAVDVYGNAAAAAALRSGAFEPGAMFVKEQFDRTVAGDRAAGILAMEKRERGYDPDGGDWRWIVIGAKGELVREGKIERCTACHRDASHDFVFAVE